MPGPWVLLLALLLVHVAPSHLEDISSSAVAPDSTALLLSGPTRTLQSSGKGTRTRGEGDWCQEKWQGFETWMRGREAQALARPRHYYVERERKFRARLIQDGCEPRHLQTVAATSPSAAAAAKTPSASLQLLGSGPRQQTTHRGTLKVEELPQQSRSSHAATQARYTQEEHQQRQPQPLPKLSEPPSSEDSHGWELAHPLGVLGTPALKLNSRSRGSPFRSKMERSQSSASAGASRESTAVGGSPSQEDQAVDLVTLVV